MMKTRNFSELWERDLIPSRREASLVRNRVARPLLGVGSVRGCSAAELLTGGIVGDASVKVVAGVGVDMVSVDLVEFVVSLGGGVGWEVAVGGI